MRGVSAVLLLLICSTLFYSVTGFVMQETSMCQFGDNKQGNASFQYYVIFNRQNILHYSEEADMFIPCASYYTCIPEVHSASVLFTTKLNTDPTMGKYVANEKKRCSEEVTTFWDRTVERRVKPSMEVFSPDKVHVDNLPLLICYVWGFYPKEIIVAWIKNNEAVVKNYTQGVRVGDWSYQVVAKLDLRDSRPEDNYTCIVEHSSLDEPMMKNWKAGLTSIQVIKISVSAVIFGLGLICLIVGGICWKNAKRSGYSPIPGYNDVN